MAIANSSIVLADLDFDKIKQNLKTFLQQQPILKDYNYDNSALSIILDLLAYNTHYNAFYLNMVANEMFLDTCLKRSSAISYAKLLNYTPKSAKSSFATISLTCHGVSDSSITIPKFTKFYSKSVNSLNYQFVTLDTFIATPDINQTVVFNNIDIYQGQPINLNYTFIGADNFQRFKLPDSNIDTSTIRVHVYQNYTSTTYTVFNLADDYISLTPTSTVYFIQESLDGFYEIFFGDGILGKNLIDSNVINISYLVIDTSTPNGIDSFYLMNNIGNYNNHVITNNTASSLPQTKESIEQIKLHAPKSFSAQKRAVTQNDYIIALNQNSLGITFDAVNVWGGQDNIPPVYGKVFICLKPTGNFNLTNTQKEIITKQIIKPISVMTVDPVIIDPDYTFLQFNIVIYYDKSKTTLTQNELSLSLKNLIKNYVVSTLNNFNSKFLLSELDYLLLTSDASILTNDINVRVQKKFYPDLLNPKNYILNFGTPLKKQLSQDGIYSSPGMSFADISNTSNTHILDVFIEEDPKYEYGYGIDSINIINPGYGFLSEPIVTITGDGQGATANVILTNSGSIQSIVINSSGYGYTVASANISGGGGKGVSTAVKLKTQIGYLRSYYYMNNDKHIYSNTVGTVDYSTGIVSLNFFNPNEINNSSGQLNISAVPLSNYITSSFNQILTFDLNDENAINLTLISK